MYQPHDIEARMRNEEQVAHELLMYKAAAEDLREQLMAAVSLLEDRTGATRQELNVKIAQRMEHIRLQDLAREKER